MITYGAEDPLCSSAISGHKFPYPFSRLQWVLFIICFWRPLGRHNLCLFPLRRPIRQRISRYLYYLLLILSVGTLCHPFGRHAYRITEFYTIYYAEGAGRSTGPNLVA